ncbi:hypothetical protein ACVHNB_18575 [Streptomyces sp. YJ-C3]
MRRPLLFALLAAAVLATGCTTVGPDDANPPRRVGQFAPEQGGQPAPVRPVTSWTPRQPAAREALADTSTGKSKEQRQQHQKKSKKSDKPKKSKRAAKFHEPAARPDRHVAEHSVRRPAARHRTAPTAPRRHRPAARPPVRHQTPEHRPAPPRHHQAPRPQPRSTYDLRTVCQWGDQIGMDPSLSTACHQRSR